MYAKLLEIFCNPKTRVGQLVIWTKEGEKEGEKREGKSLQVSLQKKSPRMQNLGGKKVHI